jgi:hypothetical protein
MIRVIILIGGNAIAVTGVGLIILGTQIVEAVARCPR